MKENPLTNCFNSTLDQSISAFTKKGGVGDWKDQFTGVQTQRFDEIYSQEMEGTSAWDSD